MEIWDDTLAFEAVWEGELREQVVMRGSGMPPVAIGKPVWWNDNDVFGKGWVAPVGSCRYRLIRFAFALRPEKRHRFRRVDFEIRISNHGENSPTFYDVFPRTQFEERTGEVGIAVGPDLKFAALDASIGSVSAKINIKQAFPVVTVSGTGESEAGWLFESRPAHPLIGSQSVYCIVEIPDNVAEITAKVWLTAEILDERWGVLKGLVPDEASSRLSFALS